MMEKQYCIIKIIKNEERQKGYKAAEAMYKKNKSLMQSLKDK